MDKLRGASAGLAQVQLGCYTFVNPPSGHQRTLSGPRPDHAYPDRAAPRRFSEMPKGRSWLAHPFAGGGACDLRSLTRPLVPVGLSPSYLPCSSMPDRSLVELGRCSRRPLPRFEKTEREGAVSPRAQSFFSLTYPEFLCSIFVPKKHRKTRSFCGGRLEARVRFRRWTPRRGKS